MDDSAIPAQRYIWTKLDVQDGIILTVAALVLPLLPNHAIDPFGLLNPFALWRLVVVLMSISALGYCAMRILGPKYALPISGFAAGFISSTVAIAALGSRAISDADLITPSATGAVASILGSLFYLVALVAAADPALLRPLVLPFCSAVFFTLVYALVLAWRGRVVNPGYVRPSRAFDLRTIVLFVGLVAAFSLLSWKLMGWFGEAGVLASVTATALIDAHAAAVSVATLVGSGKMDGASGAFAILVGYSANMMAKVPTAFALGPRRFAMMTSAGLIILIAALWSGYAWNAAATYLFR
jgi:uncharacterized membrane protein (DUF4010 family)